MTTLTPVQEQVLASISASSTICEAASSAGIHRNTIHNWLRTPSPFFGQLAAVRDIRAGHWRDQAEQHGAVPVTQAIPPAGRAQNCQNLHNSAQSKTGRNETCPCGSCKKLKRCCLNKPITAAA